MEMSPSVLPSVSFPLKSERLRGYCHKGFSRLSKQLFSIHLLPMS